MFSLEAVFRFTILYKDENIPQCYLSTLKLGKNNYNSTLNNNTQLIALLYTACGLHYFILRWLLISHILPSGGRNAGWTIGWTLAQSEPLSLPCAGGWSRDSTVVHFIFLILTAATNNVISSVYLGRLGIYSSVTWENSYYAKTNKKPNNNNNNGNNNRSALQKKL